MSVKMLGLGSAMVVVVCALVAGSSASASEPSDPPPTSSVPVVGTLHGPARAKKDGIALVVKHDTTVRTFTLTYPPGSYSGWHVHPGIVLAVVQKGTVIRQVGCRSQRFTAGESFTETAPHQVSNALETGTPGVDDAVLSITQLLPIDAPKTRFETRPPKCHHRGHR